MGFAIDMLRMRKTTAGGVGSGIRSSNIQYVNNSAGIIATLPSGSVAGDDLILFAAHGWPPSTPSGFTVLDTQSGANTNGGTYKKTLTGTDISNGTITVGFSNLHYGVVALITMVGAYAVRTNIGVQHGSGATSRTVTTDATPQVGDIALWFGMGRANIVITCNRGSQRDTTSNFEASGVLNAETMASGGAASGIFTFGSAPSGDYAACVVLH